MSKFENDYKALLRRIIEVGVDTPNRTRVDTVTLFGQQLTIDLNKGFPIITGKKIFFNKAYHEYKWIMNGGTNTKYLKERGIHWWDKFTVDGGGYLGKTYGYQLRNFNGITDQLELLYPEIIAGSRRACITLWNPSELKETMIPPCYTFFNFVRIGNKLNLAVTFRSSDVFLGLPYDICVLAIMLKRVAWFTQLIPNTLKLNLDNAHLYSNHGVAISSYLDAETYDLPHYKAVGEELINYKSGPYIKAVLNH